MQGQKVGYIRVSSIDQNTIRQLDGIPLDKVFTEKRFGKSTDRPILQECIMYLRHGDTLYVHSIDRLARNAKDLLNLVEQLLLKEITINFVKNNLTFSNANTDHMAKLQLTMLGAFAEFERERQREGIAIAKLNGKYNRPRKLNELLINDAKRRIDSGEPLSVVSRSLCVSRQSLYKYGLESTLPFGKKVSQTE